MDDVLQTLKGEHTLYRIGKARDKSTKDFMEWFYANRISWNGVLIATERGCHQTWWPSKCRWEARDRQVDLQEAEGCVSLSELSDCFLYQHVLTINGAIQKLTSTTFMTSEQHEEVIKARKARDDKQSYMSRSILFLHPTRHCETLQPVS